MLLEFPHGHLIPGGQKMAQWLMDRGIRPMIAHPERNKQIMKDPSQLQPYIESGCWLQVTAGSVTGHFGEKSQSVAYHLLDEDLVTVLGSDGHNSSARPPVLRRAFDVVSRKYGEQRAQRLLLESPWAMAKGQFSNQDLA